MGKWKDGYLTEEAIPIKMQVAKNGFYEFDLPVGTYNVFVQDNGKKYCVGICWITIKRDEIKENNIRINHASD